VICGRPLSQGVEVRALPRGRNAARPSPARGSQPSGVTIVAAKKFMPGKVSQIANSSLCHPTQSSAALYARLTRVSKLSVMDATQFCGRAMKVCFARPKGAHGDFDPERNTDQAGVALKPASCIVILRPNPASERVRLSWATGSSV
jgi:hypothetical protein